MYVDVRLYVRFRRLSLLVMILFISEDIFHYKNESNMER